MEHEAYETPKVTVLGDVADVTQRKSGILFDFPQGSSDLLDLNLNLHLDLAGLKIDIS